jgi:hypothetical protein
MYEYLRQQTNVIKGRAKYVRHKYDMLVIISQKDKEKRWQGFLSVSMMLPKIHMYVVGGEKCFVFKGTVWPVWKTEDGKDGKACLGEVIHL